MSSIIQINRNITTKLNLSLLPFYFIFFLATSNLKAGDLVLHLTFDKFSGPVVKDQSGFGHNATFNVQPREIKGPLGNQAAKLDGISWAEIEDSDDLDLMTALTIEAWVFISSDEKQIVVEKGATWKRDGEYSLLFYEKRRPVIQAQDLADNCDDEAVGDEIPRDTLTHIAGTWDSKAFKLYINGELNLELECAGKLLKSQESLYIGSRGGGLRFLKGSIDDLRIYNYALENKQIRMDMENKLLISKKEKIATTWGRVKAVR